MFVKTLLSVTLVLCSVMAYAETFSRNGIVYEIQSSNEVYVVNYESDCPVDVVIPTTVDSYQVKEINDGVFTDFATLRTIQIPSTIVRIGSSNFAGCTSLEAINIVGTTGKYSSEDGILYANRNDEKKQRCPAGSCARNKRGLVCHAFRCHVDMEGRFR